MTIAELHSLYAELNESCFDGCLPPCRITWSRRLTRTAGNIDVRRRIIKLSVPLLIEAFATDGTDQTSRHDGMTAPVYEVCGVPCASSGTALHEILKHEMIHLWLHMRGLPSGHTAEFRAKARALGQPRTRHGIKMPLPRAGWIYSCPACRHEFTRQRRYGRPVACARCCRRFNKGQYHERYKLKGRRI